MLENQGRETRHIFRLDRVQGDECAAADILGLLSRYPRPDLCSGLRQILEAMKDH